MFLNIPGPIDYQDPWLASYDDRIRQMSSNRRRIAYFYPYPDTSTFRYRAFNPGLTLAAAPEFGVSAAWFNHDDLCDGDDGFLEHADALVVCRTRYDAMVSRMLARAHALGIPVLFDCDDLVFDLECVHLLIESLDKDQSKAEVWDFWFAHIGRMNATFKLCDGLITTNEFLAGRARLAKPGLVARIMPNYLNPEQQELSETMFAIKKESGWARDDRIHIGYFSGSLSHARDFAIAAPALVRLMDRDPRVHLRVVGFLDRDGEIMRHSDRIEFLPLQDFMNLQRLIAEVEINIAPLQDNTFTNCKSELKYFEAAICGTLTVASPIFTFANSIINGETGILSAPFQWDQALKDAVAIVDSKEKYAEIAEKALAHVQRRYGWNQQAEKILDAVFGSAFTAAGAVPPPLVPADGRD
jgi:glycosyltransferase involved in cell wall biosynthesis